jgi:hypothetical protein
MLGRPTAPQHPVAKAGEPQCDKYGCVRKADKVFYLGTPVFFQTKYCPKHTKQFEQICKNEGAIYRTHNAK